MALKKGMYRINGVERMIISDIERESLAEVLRRIGLTSVKVGCGVGQCGTCTVLVDGKPVRACTKKFKNIPEHTCIDTLEGIGTAELLHPLQLAWIAYGGVQCGFCTPGFIMSAKALLKENINPTRQEVRHWFTKNANLCRCTGYKPLVDSVIAAAAVMRGEMTREDLQFKVPENGRIYNTHYPRPDALAKVMGAADYGDDLGIKMPEGTLHLAVTWSAYAHANILGINTAAAESMPGVARVLTYQDVQGTNELGSPLAHLRSRAGTVCQPILCETKVRRMGDAVALVVADTAEHARAAAQAVKVDYQPLPEYKSYLEACLPDAVSIDGVAPNDMLRQPLFKGEDTRPIFERANQPGTGIYAVEGSFYSSRQPHLPLEPWSLQAYYDEDEMLTINYKSQTLWVGMFLLPRALGCPADKLRIIEIPCGGSFGSSMDWQGPAMIGVAEMTVKKPITWTCTYEETQRFTGKRAPSYSNVKLACDGNGKILAMDFDSVLDHGANAQTAGSLEMKLIRFFGYPYNVPNIRGLARAGLSNQPFAVAYRAYGSPQAYTSSEQLIDMMAEKLGIDPFEMRYTNAIVPGDLTNNSYPFKVYSVKRMLDKMRPYYQESLEWAKQPAPSGWKRGIGVACGGYHVSTPVDISTVALELMPDGSVTHYNCWEEMGQGSGVGTLVHTHEALRPLGLPPEKIRLYQNDTKYCPATGAAAGSRSHYMAGNATLDAAKKLLDAMRKDDGSYRTYDEMAAEGIPTKYEGVFSTAGLYQALSVDTGVGDPMPDNNYLVSVARVEVEESTGKTTVAAVHSVADVGVIGSFQAVEGQAYGGMMHSIGFALTEDYSDDVKKYGTPLGCGFMRCNEVPDDMEFAFQETPRATGPHGSGGCSENFQSSGHVAVINAICNAVGARIYAIPATPEKIKAALRAKAEGKDMAPQKYYLGEDYNDILDYIRANPLEMPAREEHAVTMEEVQRGGH